MTTTHLGNCPACQCRPADDWESAYAHAYDWAYIHELMSLDDAERFASWFATHYADDYDDAPSYRFALSQWR